MTRPSLRVFEGGKGRTPSNVEIHAFAKDMDLESEEKAERRKETRDAFGAILVVAFLIKMACWLLGDL